MAPKRKNKKPASNPARGFATTSTASKAKAPNEIAAEDTISEIVLDGNGYVQQPRNKDAPADKELHQLSPEELEKQLEESDLNLFLETNSEKVKRDVARQVNKLQTEKRLVRIQAEVLHTRFWLPPEIVELILDAVLVDQSIERQDHKILGVSKNDGLSEDDLSLKLWTLKQVLVQLGFPYGLCQEALQYLLPMLQEPTVRERLVGKDGIWGLDCCLDWMALHCTSQQAPSYLPCQEKTDVMPILEQDPGASLQFEKADSGERAVRFRVGVATLLISNINLVSVSPGSAMSRPSQPSSCSNEFEGGASLCAGTTPITTDSDIESDMDPDTMTDRYIELRTRLYQIKPDSGEERKPQNLLTDRTQPPQVSKLLRRLEQLQSDILFDRYEAEQKWTEKRNQLAQATAQRRKLQLDDANRSGGGFSSKQKAETTTSDSVCETSDEDEEDGGVGALGDFFSGLQDTTFLDNHGTLKSNGEDASRPLLTVRDFGKWTGISPRRVLEEACKARLANLPQILLSCIWHCLQGSRH